MTGARYEAIEVAGKWHVLDHHHPEAEAMVYAEADAAFIAVQILNIVSGWYALEKKYEAR